MIYFCLILLCYVIGIVGSSIVMQRAAEPCTEADEAFYYQLFLLFALGFGMILPCLIISWAVLTYIGGKLWI